MNESDIAAFWNSHPCGEESSGSLAAMGGAYEEFFERYDAFRYGLETHIPRCLDDLQVRGKRVLEIGLGQGADSEQLIRRGAVWSGVDLTEEAVTRVRTRLALRGLPYEHLQKASVLALPFADHTFDVIFSHGVLHHVPGIEQAQRELHRVLKPNGVLVAMLYAKWSLNYLVSIAVVRRLVLLLMLLSGASGRGKSAQHVINAKRIGVRQYLALRNFIHKNTDGPLNPYSKVYDLALVAKDFPKFSVVQSHKEFMYAPPLPVYWMPLAKLFGWHLWVHMSPNRSDQQQSASD
jgi:SAM-dependent methyltransferase